MKLPDPGVAPARVANRILERETWARDKLLPFAGRVFTLAIGPLVARFRITSEGILETPGADATADLVLKLSPLTMPAFLANPLRWNEFVREEGDPELGGALKDLARTMPWFIEAAFAQALGPLAGQRAASAGRSLLAFPEYAAQRATESIASYVRDESGMLARGDELPPLRDAIRDVAARVDALESRFAALTARIRAARPQPLPG